jgi:hypothetical protein
LFDLVKYCASHQIFDYGLNWCFTHANQISFTSVFLLWLPHVHIIILCWLLSLVSIFVKTVWLILRNYLNHCSCLSPSIWFNSLSLGFLHSYYILLLLTSDFLGMSHSSGTTCPKFSVLDSSTLRNTLWYWSHFV